MNDRPNSMATVETASTKTSDYRRLFVAGLYAVFAFWGCVSVVTQNGLVYSLASLLTSSFATAWCVADTRLRGKPLLPVLQMIVFLTWPIAVPIYLVASRKWRGFAYSLLHTVGLYGITVICHIALTYVFLGRETLESLTR